MPPSSEDTIEKDSRTVFVRGVSFDVDEKTLADEFSDVGPIKSAFMVKHKGQEKHRGFGFVQFALPEDAVRAVQILNGKVVAGRKILVSAAAAHPTPPPRLHKASGARWMRATASAHVPMPRHAQGHATVGAACSPGKPLPIVSLLGTTSSQLMLLLLPQVELAEKRAPMEERKRKRKDDSGAPEDDADVTAAAAAGASAEGTQPMAVAALSAKEKKKAREARSSGIAAAAEAVEVGATGKAPAAAASKREKRAPQLPAEKEAVLEKHRLIRTVAIGNLTSPAVAAAAIVLASKLGKVMAGCECSVCTLYMPNPKQLLVVHFPPLSHECMTNSCTQVEEVINPVPEEMISRNKLRGDGCSGNVAFVVYSLVRSVGWCLREDHAG